MILLTIGQFLFKFLNRYLLWSTDASSRFYTVFFYLEHKIMLERAGHSKVIDVELKRNHLLCKFLIFSYCHPKQD